MNIYYQLLSFLIFKIVYIFKQFTIRIEVTISHLNVKKFQFVLGKVREIAHLKISFLIWLQRVNLGFLSSDLIIKTQNQLNVLIVLFLEFMNVNYRLIFICDCKVSNKFLIFYSFRIVCNFSLYFHWFLNFRQ